MDAPAQLVLMGEDRAEFLWEGRLLARYQPALPATDSGESPRPFLHPVRTLGGKLVTDYRPGDHPWHHGISWVLTYVNETNFWGGPSFDSATRSYLWAGDHGAQAHVRWEAGGPGILVQEVAWLSAAGKALILESRRIGARILGLARWRLDFQSEFLNCADQSLILRSPTARGRPEGGYFGLTWRGPPSWAFGRLGAGAASMMGRRAPQLIYERWNRERGVARLTFLDRPGNPRHPTPWFERHQDQPIVSAALAYAEPWILAPGGRLNLAYAIEIEDLPS